MRKNTTTRIGLAAAALACTIAAVPAPAQNQAPGGTLVRPHPTYPSNAVVAGRSVAEWSAEWAQYAYSAPQALSPFADPTGAACTFMQHGPVWFLVGTAGGIAARTCTMPEGKAVMLPLINLVDVNTAKQSAAELRAEAAGCIDAVSQLRLEIDGVPVPAKVVEAMRVKSPAFELALPSTDPNVPAASIFSPVINDGYLAMLAPLPPGKHTVRFGGMSAGCYYAPTNFQVQPWSVDVTYLLTVEPVNLR